MVLTYLLDLHRTELTKKRVQKLHSLAKNNEISAFLGQKSRIVTESVLF